MSMLEEDAAGQRKRVDKRTRGFDCSALLKMRVTASLDDGEMRPIEHAMMGDPDVWVEAVAVCAAVVSDDLKSSVRRAGVNPEGSRFTR